MYTCFATTSRGIEKILRKELSDLGAGDPKIEHSGVGFSAPLPLVYKLCLFLRTANRVLLTIGTGTYKKENDFYLFAKAFRWEEHMDVEKTFAITASSRDKAFTHTSYLSLQIKDGLADRFREIKGRRPSVDTDKPDISFHIHAESGEIILYLDASGGSLHERGYRKQRVEAGLKEHAAAAMLLASDWPTIYTEGGGLIDFMCGAGTIPIEGALMAHDIPPGIYRRYFGYYHWKYHNYPLWKEIREQAKSSLQGMQNGAVPSGGTGISGFDKDGKAVSAAQANAKSAQVLHLLSIRRKALHELEPISPGEGGPPGLICINPPYGIRLEKAEAIPSLYQEIGRVLKRSFTGWKASILVPDEDAGKLLGLQADFVSPLSNGEIPSKLIGLTVSEGNTFRVHFPFYHGRGKGERVESHGEDLKNRLNKNRKKLKSYLKNNGVSCYRIYDADIPEYAAVVDIYGGAYAYIQEYEAPGEIPPAKARFRLIEIVNAVSEVFGIGKENVYLVQRKVQRNTRQYGKIGTTDARIAVREGDLAFYVNLVDFLDTGLFLEHRHLRQRIRDESRGKRFLNLFAYTCTASVYALAGKASRVLSVDTNKHYLQWGEQNCRLNGLPAAGFGTLCMDSMLWLRRNSEKFDLIFIDPPSFSNSKDREGDFILERDYPELLTLAMRSLSPGGTIYFTAHLKGFRPDFTPLKGADINTISKEITPPDFLESRGAYNCYQIMLRKSHP